MLITFFLSKKTGKLRSQARILLGRDDEHVSLIDDTVVYNVIPSYDIGIPIEPSTKTMAYVYKVLDFNFVGNDLIVVTKAEFINFRDVITVEKGNINGDTCKIFSINASLPMHVWYQPSERAIKFALGDLPHNEDWHPSDLVVVEEIRSFEEKKAFNSWLYTNEFMKAYGHLRLLLARGPYNGLINNLFKMHFSKVHNVIR